MLPSQLRFVYCLAMAVMTATIAGSHWRPGDMRLYAGALCALHAVNCSECLVGLCLGRPIRALFALSPVRLARWDTASLARAVLQLTAAIGTTTRAAGHDVFAKAVGIISVIEAALMCFMWTILLCHRLLCAAMEE
jgi:hypothetical protein